MKKIPVAILGATGLVGQQFINLLTNHPWFEIVCLTASERSAGHYYQDAVKWHLPTPMPSQIGKMKIERTEPGLNAKLLFSALPKTVASELEPKLAKSGHIVVSNASAHRMDPLVPLIVPEINHQHLEIIPQQQQAKGFSGFIITNPNCAVISTILPLKILHDRFTLKDIMIITMQAISGAGYDGIPAMAIHDNLIPFISGEDEKLITEPKKLLGSVGPTGITEFNLNISGQANRVPVLNGHLAIVSVRAEKRIDPEEAVAAIKKWQPDPILHDLPTAPKQTLYYHNAPNRPQPRLDQTLGNGMAWSIGKITNCSILDIRFTSLTHNTMRGAAGGAVLNAELLVKSGFFS